jgi:hypothetical protein
MKHEIGIGKIYNLDAKMEVAKRTIVINEAQKNIILLFANKSINKDGFPVYNINGCEFEIFLHFEDKPYYKEVQEALTETTNQ